ncbi:MULTISPECIES: SPOR domain-containing protein [Microbulbifer]|uniref:SPOR domain-containing protein n=1 Tax=Microbulbifer TaxID=48073 RepID=UPI001E4D9C3F|nr:MULTISPECIES: SPOR domain-containing protein [Microbulbifer]UHQ55016.1 SPOR domain-containing protein [Microbulbifer sp. YPW16]
MASRDRAPGKRGRLDDGFKQRIVGALVLAALAVIFLPSLFDREGARYIDVTSQIPPAPDIQPIRIAEPEPVADAAPAPHPDDAFQPALASEPAEPEPAPAEPAAEADQQAQPGKVADAPVLDARGLPVAWVVQVASYSRGDRAESLRNRLMDEGYKAFTREVSTDRGRYTRVFVGPKTSKADAGVVKRELDQLLDVQTLVLRFKA